MLYLGCPGKSFRNPLHGHIFRNQQSVDEFVESAGNEKKLLRQVCVLSLIIITYHNSKMYSLSQICRYMSVVTFLLEMHYVHHDDTML